MLLTQEQGELKDLVRRSFEEHVTSEVVRRCEQNHAEAVAGITAALREIGLEEAFSPDGGSLGFTELATVAEEAGRVLLPLPIVERIFLANSLAALKVGELPGGPSTGCGIAPRSCCSLEHESAVGTISGRVEWAYGVAGASHLMVWLPSGEGAIVSLSDSGVTQSRTTSLDLSVALYSLTLSQVSTQIIPADAARTIEDRFEILKASEMYGVAQRVMEMTVAHVTAREQFGVPVGGFQAIQQKLADAYAHQESLGSLARFAAWSVDHSPEQTALTARSAIALATKVGPEVCEACLQAHGGIGFTWEYDLHLYLRRAQSIRAAFAMTAERDEELLRRAVGEGSTRIL